MGVEFTNPASLTAASVARDDATDSQHHGEPIRLPRRIAMLSLHTSPLDQPGSGDAGGMNVYIRRLSEQLVARGVAVEIFTRATSASQPPVVELNDGVLVHHLAAGPYGRLRKEDLPGQLCAMSAGLLRVEASRGAGYFDLIHSHYWLSGQVGWVASERWGVPLVHSMHTMGKVKNASQSAWDTPEPSVRVVGEEQVVAAATELVANTAIEADELLHFYRADPERVRVVHPGVDLTTFTPGDRSDARAQVSRLTEADSPVRTATGIADRGIGRPLADDDLLIAFVGRIQPLKGLDVLLRAACLLRESDPELARRLRVIVVGGPSGSGARRTGAINDLIEAHGLADAVSFIPPVAPEQLREVYRAADVLAVPSFSESFGLVAIEAEACGTPVVAAAVGGLPTAVADGESGLLVDGHDPRDWARALAAVLTDPALHARLSAGARTQAERFSWQRTTDAILDVYSDALRSYAREGRLAEGPAA